MQKQFGKKIIIALVISLGFYYHLLGQDNTMYYMDGIPGKTYLNPAKQPTCGFYIAPPVLSQFNIQLYNSAFTISDVIFKSEFSDSIIHPFHPEADVNDFIDLFKESNIISFENSFNIASFGFRANQMYFTFNIALNTNVQFGYPGDFMTIAGSGFENGGEYDFESFGINSKMYLSYGIGISRKIYDNISVGIRPKFYSGIYSIHTNFESASLRTSYQQWDIAAKGDISMALPIFDPPVNSNGELPMDTLGSLGDLYGDVGTGDISSALLDNKGFGIDLGVWYKPYPFIEFSASIIDLGTINWKKHTHSIDIDGEFTLGPIDIDDFNESFDSVFTDSLRNEFQIEESAQTFKTGIDPKLFLGGRYFVTENFDIGLLSRTIFYNNHIRQDLSLSTNFRPSRAFNLSLSYNLLDGDYSSFGFGFSVRLGILHWYLITDNIGLNRYNIASEDLPIQVPVFDTKSYNLRMGFNLTFGNNKEKKQMRDLPLLYNENAFIY